MASETQIASRQQKILKLLSRGSLARENIQKSLKISKATLSRDLSNLLLQKLIKSSGVGRATIYVAIDKNPLLKPTQKKLLNKTVFFNFEIFNHLSNLFTQKEISHLNNIHKSLNGQIVKLGNTIAKKELERFVIELAWKSSQIEGNTYSLLETEALIKMNQEAVGHSKEETAMILNHKTAFDTILANKDDFKKINLSDITQLHNILVQNLNVEPGIRKHPVGITGSIYRPLDNEWQIKEALEKLIEAINSSKYPFEKALIASSMIAYIQPFADGNKRTSRMLANAILIAWDYYPVSYRTVREIKYKQAIIDFYEQVSLLKLKHILVEQYKFALDNYFRTVV